MREPIKDGKYLPLVTIVMGSNSDVKVMVDAVRVLGKFGVPYEVKVLSAHRTPDEARAYAKELMDRGVKVVIAAAGWAAHLAGAIAAQTILPVIGVPIDSSPIPGGLDALLSTVQMPPGIPVGTMAVGKGGAYNAAVFAVQILALSDLELQKKLLIFRREMAEEVLGKKTRRMEEDLEAELARDKK